MTVFDLDELVLKNKQLSGIASFSFRTNDRLSWALRFLQDATFIELPAGSNVCVGLKLSRSATGYLAMATNPAKTGAGSSAIYTFDLNLNTESMASAMSSDSIENCVLEVEVVTPTQRLTSRGVTTSIQRDVISNYQPPVEVPDFKATQAEAEAGTADNKWMTPLRTAQAIAASPAVNVQADWNATSGEAAILNKPNIASTAEAEAGTDNTKMMTPLRTAEAISELGGAGSEGFALDPNAKITGSEGNAETEFGGWGVGMQLADNNATGATMEPDGFRAYSDGTVSFWQGVLGEHEVTVRSAAPTSSYIALVGDDSSTLSQLIVAWNAANPSNTVSSTIVVDGDETPATDLDDFSVGDGFIMQFSGGLLANTTQLSSSALTLDNGAKLRKGTTDGGDGGYRGIALECSAQYELKWEAGRLYAMEQDGFTIRCVEHCPVAPTSADDSTKGFVVGSRWVTNDKTLYTCTYAGGGAEPDGAAQWTAIHFPTALTGTLALTSNIPAIGTTQGTVAAGNDSRIANIAVATGTVRLGSSTNTYSTLSGSATSARSIALPDASGTIQLIPETRMVYWVGDGSADVVNATTGYLKTSRALQPPMPIAASRDLYLTVRNVTGVNRAIILPRQQTQIDGNGDTRDILNLGPAPSAHTDKAKNGDRLILDYRATTNSTITVKAYPFNILTLANVGGVIIPYVGYYTNLWGGTTLSIENYADCNLITITAEGLYAFELVDGAWAYRGLVSGTHTHGSLTSDGKLGTSANCYVTTTTGGAIIAGGSFYNKYTQTVTASGTSATNPSAYGKRSEQIFIFNANCLMQFQLSAGVLGDVIAVTAQAGTSALGSVQVTNSTVAEIATLQVGHSREFIYNGTAWELVPLRSSGGVTQIIAGSNVSISQTSGTGAVTVNTTNSPFVLTAASASGTAGTTGQTVGPFISYFNMSGGAGYSSNISNRQRSVLQACVIKKACITLSSGNATVVSDGVVSFYNNTTSTDYVLFNGLVADTTSTFVTHDATNLNIPVAAGEKFSFKIIWPTTNPANVRVMVDLYCYPV